MNEGIQPVEYISLGSGPPQEVQGSVPQEALACISVNGQEIASMMCSPLKLDELALGFLFNERIIQSMSDIRSIHISDNYCVEFWLAKSFTAPERRIITAGCGGGVTFDDLSGQHTPIESELQVTPTELSRLMKELHQGANLYRSSRGIHTALLARGPQILIQVEDIGRHNCLDRLAGAALNEGIDTSGCILMSSGRVSSEMINKARHLQTPVVCSRTSPTSLSVALAKSWNITLVAYLRKSRMRIYSAPDRVIRTETLISAKSKGG